MGQLNFRCCVSMLLELFFAMQVTVMWVAKKLNLSIGLHNGCAPTGQPFLAQVKMHRRCMAACVTVSNQ